MYAHALDLRCHTLPFPMLLQVLCYWLLFRADGSQSLFPLRDVILYSVPASYYISVLPMFQLSHNFLHCVGRAEYSDRPAACEDGEEAAPAHQHLAVQAQQPQHVLRRGRGRAGGRATSRHCRARRCRQDCTWLAPIHVIHSMMRHLLKSHHCVLWVQVRRRLVKRWSANLNKIKKQNFVCMLRIFV